MVDRAIAYVQVAAEANSASPAEQWVAVFEHHRAYSLCYALRTPVRVEEIQPFGRERGFSRSPNFPTDGAG